MDKTISVGMTTYNSEKYIERQLISIINQSILPDEIVIVDDCSNDNTVSIINKLIKNCKQNIIIKLIVNKSNLGFVRNFEKCFLACTGDIIFSCDADDIWHKDKIESILRYFQNDDVAMVYHDAYVIDENEKIILESLYKDYFPLSYCKNKDEFIERCLKKGGFPFGMTIAFKKKILENIVPFPFSHDEWISHCAPMYGNVIYVEKKLVDYRRHGNNLSGENNLKENKYKKIKRKIVSSTKEAWFTYPIYQYEGYVRYLNLFGDKLSNENLTFLKNEIHFKKYCIDIVNANKIKSILLLFKCYKSGMYRMFRGNANSFFIDLIYILIK